MSMTLYAAAMSSAMPVVAALAELELAHEIVMLDLAAGDQKRPEYLALNPHGVVPTLVVDGTPMFETLAILQWLGERHGVGRGLWPAADTPERLQALSWTTWIYVSYGAALQRLNAAQSDRVDASLHHPPLAASAKAELDAMLGRLDNQLDGRSYLLGENYSLADLTLACVVTYGGFCGAPVTGHPNLVAWLERINQRPGFRRAWE